MLDRYAKMLEDAGHRPALPAGLVGEHVCRKCNTPWPCETATRAMGPDLSGFDCVGDAPE